MAYAVNVTIGTPGQQVALQLDLSWDVLFVPSAACSDDWPSICEGHSKYNSSASSSFRRTDPYPPPCQGCLSGFVYGGVIFEGNLTLDNVNIGDLKVDGQLFLEADNVRSIGYLNFYHLYDGALGLAPFPIGSIPNKVPSPLQMMVYQGLLDENVFSIRLPQGTVDPYDPPVGGEITFGVADQTDLVRLPLTHRTEAQVWAVDIESFSFGDDATLHQEFENGFAVFDTADIFIGLPSSWAYNLTKLIGAERNGAFAYIPCEKRAELPDLTFKLADHNFTLTAYEYTLPFEPHGEHCRA